MISIPDGQLEGDGLKVGIVVARFNGTITSRLLSGTKEALFHHGVCETDVIIAYVPGSFEIPIVANKIASSGKYDAVICLGAVIRGDTDHYEYIAREAARGIAAASVETGVPIIFGVLTTDNVQQAIDRSGGDGSESVMTQRSTDKFKGPSQSSGNSGYNAGITAIHMANLIRHLDSL